MLDILFKNITVVTMVPGEPAAREACVGVASGKLAYVGAEGEAPTAKRTIGGKGKVLIPALYNCHCHTPMSLLRSCASDLSLQPWLFEHIFPAEAKFTKDMPYVGAMLSIAEMVASGTACLTDMYFGLDGIAAAAAETGVKINLSNAVVAMDCDNFDFHGDVCYKESMSVMNRYHNACGGRIKVDASIHAEYTSNGDVWLQVAEFAREHGLHMHVHLSETRLEHEQCKERHGVTPARALAAHHVFDVPATAAHCVWVEDGDIDILARHGVSVAHNPVSNLKLASGVAPVLKMLEKGVNVTLGTDGMASNNSHDLFEEIKTASIVQKGMSGDPTALPAYEALKLATVNGAAAQGRQNESGMIRAGFDADIVMLDFLSPRQAVCSDPVANLAYSVTGRDVALTMCQGKILYENGDYKTLDIEKVLYNAENAAKVFSSQP